MESCTDMEIMYGKMAANTKAIINITRSTAKERTHILTEASIVDNGKKACSMAWDAL